MSSYILSSRCSMLPAHRTITTVRSKKRCTRNGTDISRTPAAIDDETLPPLPLRLPPCRLWVIAHRYVVNFDFPKSVAAYVQRVGRTGHQGQKGWGYSFITEHHAPSAARIVGFLDATGQKVDLALRRFAERFEALPAAALQDSAGATSSSPKAQPERKRKAASRKNGAKEVPDQKRKRNPKGKRVDNRNANSSTRSGELQVRRFLSSLDSRMAGSGRVVVLCAPYSCKD